MHAHSINRRQFLQTAAAGAAATTFIPATSRARLEGDRIVVGEGEYKYAVVHDCVQLPDKYTWQTTHNVAVDSQNNVYVIHEGRTELVDHPSIFVFDADGKFIRAFGRFQGGGHGIEVRKEGGEEFLYVCAYQQLKTFAKLTLKGEVIWQRFAPMDAGVYAKGEDTNPQKVWGRDRFMPTNFAFLDNGEFFLIDGYGSYYVHHYDKEGNWKSCFGGPGDGEGTFNLPHGVWVDSRSEGEPTVVVADRAHHTLQYLKLDGTHVHTQQGYGLPANVDTWKNLMVVPELFARVTLLDEKNRVVARLGGDVQRVRGDSKFAIRSDRAKWLDGKFVHPHDACFDQLGNIYVAEWVATGRITKLQRLS